MRPYFHSLSIDFLDLRCCELAKIGFANRLRQVCESHLPHGFNDVDEIVFREVATTDLNLVVTPIYTQNLVGGKVMIVFP